MNNQQLVRLKDEIFALKEDLAAAERYTAKLEDVVMAADEIVRMWAEFDGQHSAALGECIDEIAEKLGALTEVQLEHIKSKRRFG